MEKMIRDEIGRFVLENPENRFPDTGEPYFDEPLVGFAAADDPLFAAYKEIIGDFHQTPQEVMASVFGHTAAAATVISWVLPITHSTRESNRKEKQWPSREWARTRFHGETFNIALRRHLTAWLEGLGHRAAAPQLAPGWREVGNAPAGLASTWSERHAAYAAGLGTFSLNDSLITARGASHRLGSVVTDLALLPSPRTAIDYRHNCLWCREGSCGLCISRCPVGAISKDGHDKAKCRAYVYGSVPEAVAELFGVAATGCGLCQTSVPCEAMAPPGRGSALK